jgi:hypothetical protein
MRLVGTTKYARPDRFVCSVSLPGTSCHSFIVSARDEEVLILVWGVGVGGEREREL